MAQASKKKPPSKKETIIGLLRRKHGASLADLMDATGWQAHSVRGFLSGTVKKKLGLKLDSRRTDSGLRKYYVRRAS